MSGPASQPFLLLLPFLVLDLDAGFVAVLGLLFVSAVKESCVCPLGGPRSLRLGFRHLRLSHDLGILAAELDGGRHGTDSPEQGKAGGKSVGGEPLGSSVRGGVGP